MYTSGVIREIDIDDVNVEHARLREPLGFPIIAALCIIEEALSTAWSIDTLEDDEEQEEDTTEDKNDNKVNKVDSNNNVSRKLINKGYKVRVSLDI